jgi:hypothetical protein
MLKRFFNWFRTAPEVKSWKVRMLEEHGPQFVDMLIEAIEDDRRNVVNGNYSGGQSKCGRIKVKRVFG